MKQLLVLLLVVVLSATAGADQLAFPVEKHTLDNGLTVFLIPDHSCPSVTLQIWYQTGSRNERPGITGISHLFEHLMFKGTEEYPGNMFDRLIEASGGYDNAWTWVDNTAFYEVVPPDKLELVLEMEADRCRNLILDQENLDSERNVVINERLWSVDNSPENSMYEVLINNAFVAHPYRWEVIGFMSDIESITLDECLAYYRIYYAPNNAFLIVSGDVKPETALKLVEKHFGPLRSEEPPPPVTTAEPEQRGEKRIDFRRAARLSAVMAAYKIPAGNDPDMVPLLILARILFDGESSRLQKRLVYDDQLAVNVEGDAEMHNDPYLFYVYAQANVDSDIEEVKRIIFEEIDRLALEPVSDRELQKAKNRMESEFIMGLQSNVGRANNIGMFQINTGNYETIYEYATRIQNVTVDDITRVADKYLVSDRRTVVTLYPEEHGDEGSTSAIE